MFDLDELPSKSTTEVEVTFSNQHQARGHFFTGCSQRVSDVLNDGRSFIPFVDIAGSVRLVNKSSIVDVKPAHQEDGGRPKGMLAL